MGDTMWTQGAPGTKFLEHNDKVRVTACSARGAMQHRRRPSVWTRLKVAEVGTWNAPMMDRRSDRPNLPNKADGKPNPSATHSGGRRDSTKEPDGVRFVARRDKQSDLVYLSCGRPANELHLPHPVSVHGRRVIRLADPRRDRQTLFEGGNRLSVPVADTHYGKHGCLSIRPLQRLLSDRKERRLA